MEKIILLKSSERCFVCGKDIPAGEEVIFCDSDGAAHPRCWEGFNLSLDELGQEE